MKKAILNGYALNGYTVHSNLPIGAPMPWLSDNLPVGFLAFDGSEYNISDYPELYNVVKNISSFHSETEGKFKIPNLKGRVLQGADTVIGELIEAGLPNITGEVDVSNGSSNTQSGRNFSGAFRNKQGSGYGTAEGYTDNGAHTIEFDASESNPIYGNSDTVQTNAFTVRWIIKATQYATVEQNAIDDTKFTTGNVLSAQKTKELTEEVYSDEETLVGYIILNGVKIPRYKRIFTISRTGSGNTLLDANITNAKSRLLSQSGTVILDNNTTGSIPYGSPAGNVNVFIASNGLYFYSAWGTNTDVFIVVEYTKTTD